MYQEPTNFVGRDGFHWWIGQVTDPKKGEWENSLEKKEAENEEPVYSHRCRVRIVGYHGCGDELPDINYQWHTFFYHLMCQLLVVAMSQCNIRVEKLLLDFS